MSECNVALQSITQYNSWAGSAQLTSTARLTRPQPPARASPGPCHLRSTFIRGTKYHFTSTENSFTRFFCFTFCSIIKKRSSTYTLLSLVGFSVFRCLWYPCRESRYKWRTLLGSEAFHPFYAKFLSWESPGVSVHRRLVLGTEVTVNLCCPWLNPDLDSCPSQWSQIWQDGPRSGHPGGYDRCLWGHRQTGRGRPQDRRSSQLQKGERFVFNNVANSKKSLDIFFTWSWKEFKKVAWIIRAKLSCLILGI